MAEGEKANVFAKAFWGLVFICVVGLTVYGLAYFLIRDVTVNKPHGITFEYPGASRTYATSEQGTRDLYLAQLTHRSFSFSDGNLYSYSDSWQFVTSTHKPRRYWRCFGPLERLEVALRGRSVYKLSDAQLKQLDETFEHANDHQERKLIIDIPDEAVESDEPEAPPAREEELAR